MEYTVHCTMDDSNGIEERRTKLSGWSKLSVERTEELECRG